MKKISSKIIISVLLAIFLFGVVNFDFEKGNRNISLGVGKVEAENVPVIFLNKYPGTSEQEYASAQSDCFWKFNAMACIEEKIKGFWDALTPEQRAQRNFEALPPGSLIKDCEQYRDLLGYNECARKFNLARASAIEEKNKPAWSLWDPIGEFFSDTAVKAFAWIIYVILLACNVLLALAGNLFDKAVYYSIYRMTDFIGSGASISIVWASVRDLFNISYIFILLWVAIKTILGLSSANTKKMLAGVIISALLINFSLFITRIIIDGGNLVADAVYRKTISVASDSSVAALTDTAVSDTASSSGKYISTSIMDGLKIQKSYKVPEKTGDKVASNEIIMNIFRIILALVASYAFFFAAFMFVGRLIAFFILMVLSPIGFMGDLVPALNEYSKKWWDTLFNQTLVAPVFLFFMYLLIKISKETVLGSATSGSQVDVALYINFTIIIGILIVAVKITKKLSGEVGGVMTSLGGAALGVGLGLATGGAALAMRSTLGRKAQADLQDEGLKARAAAGDKRAMLSLAVAKKMAGSSMDIRNTTGFKKATGFIGDQTGIKVDYNGKTDIQKGGYAGMIKEKEKKAEEEAKFMTENIRKNITGQEQVDMYNTTKTERDNLKSKVGRTRDEDAKLLVLEKEMDKLDNGTKEEKEDLLKDKITKIKKDKRLDDLAKREENKLTNNIFGGAKEKAAKIRAAKKGKTDEQQIAEAARRIAEAEAKKVAAAAGTPTPTPAPPTPGAPHP